MSAREEVLRRVRTALSDGAGPVAVPRDYRLAGTQRPDIAAMVALLEDRLLDYKATVTRCGPGGVGEAVGSLLAARGALSVVVPDGAPDDWLATLSGVELLRDDPPLTAARLDDIDSVITGCAVAVAETGTIVLDGGAAQGRRILTLVPDYHLVVVRADQVVAAVPDAVARLDPRRALTWVSGPSATSDIELSRVEGVHGPRTLAVILVDGP